MRTLSNGWKSVTATIIVLMKGDRILLGKKNDGFMKGFVTPIGGKVDRRDKAIKQGATREIREETSLDARNLYEVGTISVKIVELKWKIRIHVFKCTWSGHIRNKSGEFQFLRFFKINEIPWDKFIPGDRDWLEKVLQGHRVQVRIICGKNRADLLEIVTRILP
jgi:8-oxo-dGTP pyrophosphatase MutT (NUDIX family)